MQCFLRSRTGCYDLQRDLDSQQEVAQTPMGFASFVMRQMVKLHFVIKCTTLHRRMPLSPSRLS